jgi:hypothetical protein
VSREVAHNMNSIDMVLIFETHALGLLKLKCTKCLKKLTRDIIDDFFIFL